MRLGAAAILAAVCLPFATQAAGESARPDYLKPSSAEFSLNHKWEGAHRVNGVPEQVLPAPADPGEMVWALACNAAGQAVVFKRTIELLGPARTPPAGLPNWDHNSGGVTFRALSGTPDTSTSNDNGLQRFIMCQDKSSAPDCTSAKPGGTVF